MATFTHPTGPLHPECGSRCRPHETQGRGTLLPGDGQGPQLSSQGTVRPGSVGRVEKLAGSGLGLLRAAGFAARLLCLNTSPPCH